MHSLVMFVSFRLHYLTSLPLQLFISSLLQIAEELRSSVYSETGLTCSAGVAANRLLAKVLLICALFLYYVLLRFPDFACYTCLCGL